MTVFKEQVLPIKVPAVTFGREHVIREQGLVYLSEEFENALTSGSLDYEYLLLRKFDEFGEEIFELRLSPADEISPRNAIYAREGETIVQLDGYLRLLKDLQ